MVVVHVNVHFDHLESLFPVSSTDEKIAVNQQL